MWRLLQTEKNPKWGRWEQRQILRVGAGRCAGPRLTVWDWLVVLLIVDAHTALAGWMHRVCADLAGCYETSVLSMVRLGWCVA